MPVIVQSKLIQYILRPLARVMHRLPEKLRTLFFVLGGCGIVGQYFLGNTNLPMPRYLVTFAFSCVMFGIMILMLLPEDIEPVVFDKKLMVPWLVVTVLMLIAGVTLSFEYLPDAMLFLVAYPIFYVVAANCTFEKVFQKFHLVNDVSYLAFLGISILFFPINGHQYTSFFNNTNGIAFYLTVPFCFALVGITNTKTSRLVFIKDLLFTATSAAIIYYTNSRTSQLAIGAAVIVAFVISIVTDRKKFAKTFLTKWVPTALAVLLMIPGTILLSQTVNSVVLAGEEMLMAHNYNEKTSEADSESKFPQRKPGHFAVGQVLQDVQNVNTTKFSTDRTANSISSGRFGIWKSYIKELRLQGHSLDYTFIVDMGPEYAHLGVQYNGSAHMTILQFAYNYGILAGIVYLLFNLISGVKSIVFALRHADRSYSLLPLAITAAFAVISLLASCIYSFNFYAAFSYYVVQCALMPKICLQCEAT